MLKFPCLVLDHDDTVVASEAAVNYPCFLGVIQRFRPGAPKLTAEEFSRWCFDPGFAQLLRDYYGFSQAEMDEEFRLWVEYAKDRIPPTFPGLKELILRHKAAGGILCVVSHSSKFNIARDYQAHFGIQPDAVFSWEDPAHQRKPNPYPLEQIMERFGFQPGELLMVDDLKPGCDMAKAVGVPVAYAGWSRTIAPELGELMRKWCDFSFETPRELERFLFED